jgi:hypothetical protein
MHFDVTNSCIIACDRRSGLDRDSPKRALSISLIGSLMKRNRAMSRCSSTLIHSTSAQMVASETGEITLSSGVALG